MTIFCPSVVCVRQLDGISLVTGIYTNKPHFNIVGCPTEVCKTNSSESVVSSRPTLGKIETMPQIGYALGKVGDNAILIIRASTKKAT